MFVNPVTLPGADLVRVSFDCVDRARHHTRHQTGVALPGAVVDDEDRSWADQCRIVCRCPGLNSVGYRRPLPVVENAGRPDTGIGNTKALGRTVEGPKVRSLLDADLLFGYSSRGPATAIGIGPSGLLPERR